jgi:hypothetical protein
MPAWKIGGSRLQAGSQQRHAVAPMIEICNQLRRHDFLAEAQP